MAATLVLPTTWQFSSGGLRIGIGAVNLGVYATGGVAVDPTLFGITTVYFAAFDGNSSGYGYSWDYTNKKVKVWVQGVTMGATGIAGYTNGAVVLADDLTETVVRLSGTAANATYEFQALKELSNAIDLSASAYNIRIRLEGV